jgi:hypothetical protein
MELYTEDFLFEFRDYDYMALARSELVPECTISA